MHTKNVAIIGAGTMGHGIAQVFAAAGNDVILTDSNPDILHTAKARIETNLERLAQYGVGQKDQIAPTLDRVALRDSVSLAVHRADLVIECVVEDLKIKETVLAAIEAHCPSQAWITSNSSSYRVSEMASALNRPGRFAGTHFWNPPYLIPLVEVVEGKDTTHATVTALREVLHAVGKYPVHVQKDIAGFVGNRLQHALRREAIALLDSGVASAEDIDACVRLGFGLRLPVVGPLAIADLGGLDLSLSIQEYLLPHLDRSTKPTATLRRLAGEGNLGAKSGRGFFEWNERDHQAVIELRDSWIINALELIQRLKKNSDSSTT